MTIIEQFKLLTEFFKQENMDYAVVGAFALYAYGYTRTTKDIDFITRIEYQEKIITFLELCEFETLHCSDGFSNHLHPIRKDRIDIIYISDQTAEIILGSAKKKLVLHNLELPVVCPEHLVALKLFAIQNDPARKFKELADIKEVLCLTNIDKAVIKELFEKYNLDEYFDESVGENNVD
jgi:hypothetical protein